VAHFGVELFTRHRGTEPPPPHHDPAVGRRIEEAPLEIRDTGACGLRGNAGQP
jgi:hypothetical protein